MGEPVGHGPRTPSDIPGNAHVSRSKNPKATPAAEEPVEKEPVKQIATGKVTVRKPPWYKRVARSMIADDAQSIGDFMLTDVLIPAARNLIRDLIVGGTDRALYGSARRSSRLGRERVSLRTRYEEMSDRGEPPRRMASRESRARHDFSEIVLDEREEAVEIIEYIMERIERYGQASVSDLYDACGVTGSFADQRWGWRGSSFNTADVRQHRGGWLLDLPAPEELRR